MAASAAWSWPLRMRCCGSSAIDATTVYSEAGVACARIARQCIQWQLGGAEFFAGIPGTLGGALAMNAGAFGGETWNCVVSVETLDRHGEQHTRVPGEYSVSYRHVSAQPAGRMVRGRAHDLHTRCPASMIRRCANCWRAAGSPSPSVNGAAARYSKIRRAITPPA